MKCIVIPTLALIAFHLTAAEPEKLLESLRAEMRAELKESSKDSKTTESPKFNRAETMLLQLASADVLKDERQSQTVQILEQIKAISFSPKIDELCGGLITELRDSSSKRSKAIREKFDSTLRSALAKGLDAKTPRELDEPLGELTKLQKEIMLVGYREDGRLAFHTDSLQAVEQILVAIQDGMLAAMSPNGKRNRDPGERLTSTISSYGRQLGDIMPRSEFLQKVQAASERIAPSLNQRALSQKEFDKSVQDLIKSAKKLEDLDGVLTKIDELSAQQRELNAYYGDSGLTSQLRNYRRIYDDLRVGAATSLSFASSGYSSQGSEALNDIKMLLVKFALTRVLMTPPDLSPKEDESVPAFLQRALDAAKSTSNWQLLSRVLDAAQSMSLTTVATTSDTSALRQFLGGVNQETAHQFSGAVSSYIAALKTGSQTIPVMKIAEALEAIQKEHPAEYEAGVRLASAGGIYPDDRVMRSTNYNRSMPYSPTSAPTANTLIVPAVPKTPTKEEKKSP